MKTTKKQSQPSMLQKYFLLFAILEVVAILAIGWLTLLQHEWFTITQYNDTQHREAEDQLSQKQKQLAQLTQLEKDYVAMDDERLQYAQRVLPIGLEPADMIARLEYLGQQSHVQIDSVDVVRGGDATVQAKPVKGASDDSAENTEPKLTHDFVHTGMITMNVTLEHSGYADLKEFLDALESFTPLLELQTLQYSNETKTFALQLRTYYIDPERL